uniref:protein-serine/threonine phosphatase n=1 Tax=Clastoptera arizonana TaxID=38151 RepID=A0A1B6DLT2_9HEMI
MGQTLSEPVTAKLTSCMQSSEFKVGSSCMQGWRINMEDAHTHILSLPDDKGTAFFAVYDGHGSAKIAEQAGKHLHKYILQRPEYKESRIKEAMQQGYLDFDSAMMDDEEKNGVLAGTTAISVLIKDGTLFCANVGDSRAIASISGQIHPLSFDHKPSNTDEARRINSAGGWVEFNRVNGNLALSRALGDFVFKQNKKKKPEEQIVTAYPDVVEKPYNSEWEFVVMACDGIWDVMSNEEVGDFVRKRIGSGMEPENICEDLMTRCLAPDCKMGGLGCDNMTVIIISCLHGKPYSNLVDQCATSVNYNDDHMS